MNLKRYDIYASSLEERSVPVVVLHVQEPIVGSRMKERKVLHGIKHSLPLLHEHMYAHKNLNKTYRLLPAPRYETSSVGLLVCQVEQVELHHPTKKVNEIEIQYAMTHKLRNLQVIDTITSIN